MFGWQENAPGEGFPLTAILTLTNKKCHRNAGFEQNFEDALLLPSVGLCASSVPHHGSSLQSQKREQTVVSWVCVSRFLAQCMRFLLGPCKFISQARSNADTMSSYVQALFTSHGILIHYVVTKAGFFYSCQKINWQ